MSSSDTDWLPTPEELERAPQLAVLSTLESTLEMTTCVLELAHPELAADQDSPYWVCGLHIIVADRILALVEQLQDALWRYRDLVRDRAKPSSLHLYNPDDLPF